MFEGYVRLGNVKPKNYGHMEVFNQDWFLAMDSKSAHIAALAYLASVDQKAPRSRQMCKNLMDGYTFDPMELTSFVKIAQSGFPLLDAGSISDIDAYAEKCIWDDTLFPFVLKRYPDSYALALSSVNLAIIINLYAGKRVDEGCHGISRSRIYKHARCAILSRLLETR